MYKRPAVLGIDSSSKNIASKAFTERMLQDFGNNTGNMIFSESLFTVLQDAKRCEFHFSPKDIEDCDVIVIAAANWVNPYSDFSTLTARIEATGLPVIICGIGAQIYDGNMLAPLKPGTTRLLKLASESSRAISVRGEFSCEVLNGYGIKNVVPTGCPSLLLSGQRVPSLRLTTELRISDIVMHGTRHLYSRAKDFQNYLYKEAFRLNTDIILQSELVDMFCVYDSLIDQSKAALFEEILTVTYGADISTVKNYLRCHGIVHTSFIEWIRYLMLKKFCIGSRVHGTIASLLSGTPAVLITHDTRTEELAIQMSLPFIRQSEIDCSRPLDIFSYYDISKFDKFTIHYSRYYNSFLHFFESVGLQVDKNFNGIHSKLGLALV
ncbi:polysaccharide pyruvyl transferase family protein [Neosynechococcus sphagnicola]|nr:polysaccharide pyruvyl transferase family protein [Neosynechococcus sphagnicola]